ncbi:hypothetical protein AKJ58_00155 [candidate division MSBL1 archaeon SCGC-AAA385D11]|uniref:Uncharacterized protein n=1 Tax=candidate division MSBL1 archaeon SCGC-AAA385D11 TaxID=1698286 RepID=A0A133VPH5_9EURY|nr:hypothetical protein AKJ58_00155 [candidate division MSBL1 archaeon SCGC-AAA385D11]
MRFRIGDKILAFDLIDLDQTVIGLNSDSFTEDGKHIFMADLDGMDLEESRKEARRLIKKFDLPHMLVFQSSEDSHHLYSLTPLTFDELVKITFESKTDYNHKLCLLHNKFATLRVTEKEQKPSSIDFKGEIENGDSERELLDGAKTALFKLTGDMDD